MAAGALRNVMQCLGVRRRSWSQSRSRELYLQEQSLEVAGLNEQRLGKGCRAPPPPHRPAPRSAEAGKTAGTGLRLYVPDLGDWTCIVL